MNKKKSPVGNNLTWQPAHLGLHGIGNNLSANLQETTAKSHNNRMWRDSLLPIVSHPRPKKTNKFRKDLEKRKLCRDAHSLGR